MSLRVRILEGNMAIGTVLLIIVIVLLIIYFA